MLDSWAVMAWLKGQNPASDQVRALFSACRRQEVKLLINILNVGEIFYLSAKSKNTRYGERVISGLRSRVAVVSANDDLVMYAATLKARYAISYADAFAAATAITHRSSLVTGDRELRTLADHHKALKLLWLGG